MGIFSNWFDKMSGKSMMVDEGKFAQRYDDAYADVNKNYANMQGIAEGMMDPYSQNNLRQRNLIMDESADASAEASRLGGRNAAMAGGAPAAVLAQQTTDASNKAQAGGMKAFNQFLGGQFNQGLSALSGVTSNMATMAGNRFNTMENLSQTNRQIDANATKFGTNLVGGMLQGGAGLLTGNPMMALGGMGGMFGAQRGGYIQGYSEGGSAKPDTIESKFGRMSMSEAMEEREREMRMSDIQRRPQEISPRPAYDWMERENDRLKNPWDRPEGGGMLRKAFEEEPNPDIMRQKQAAREQMIQAQRGMGGSLGGMLGMQEGGDPEEKRFKSKKGFTDHYKSEMGQLEGDYEGMNADEYGMALYEGPDSTRMKDLDKTSDQFWQDNRQRLLGKTGFKSGYERSRNLFTDKYPEGKDLRDLEQHYLDKEYGEGLQDSLNIHSEFQEGGEVKGHSGILSQVMGPKGPMAIKTRIGGMKIG